MQLIYEGKDITGSVDLRKAEVIDKAGNELDSNEIYANDPEGLWSKWRPAKNHVIELRNGGFTSGKMYLDEIGQEAGLMILKALPVKQQAKQSNSKGWDKVTFLELAQEFAGRHSLQLKTYGIHNYTYQRVNQVETPDLVFLAGRCLLEGYVLKISDGSLVIYDEKYMEIQASVETIYINDFNGNFSYMDKSTGIYGGCSIVFEDFSYTYTAPDVYGPIIKTNNIPVYNLAEAQRYARNITRSHNKFEKTLSFTVDLDSKFTAGNTVEVKGTGIADAKYFIYEARHRMLHNKKLLKLRQIPEGY